MHNRASISGVVLLLLLALTLPTLAEETTLNPSRRVVVHRVQPVYPEIARRLNLEGLVIVNVEVAASGHVKAVTVISGNAILAQAAMGAIREWVFAPGQEETLPVSISFNHQR